MAWYTGTSSTYLDLLDKLVKCMTANSVATAAVNAGGTGYAVGEILTAIGGTFDPSAAKFRVTAVSGGVVTALVKSEGGAYTVSPSSPVSTTSDGSGTGCTVTVTFASNGWTNNMDNTPSGEREVWLEGIGGGSDEIHIGIKTFNAEAENEIDQAYNWGFVAATGHNGSLEWWEQPDISPGFDGITGDPVTTGGAFLPLKTTDSYAMDYWFSINSRRIRGKVKMSNATITHYVDFYAGFHNQFGTSSDVPYPIYVYASSYRYNAFYADTAPRITGMTECIGHGSLVGPGFYRTPDNIWMSVKNSSASDGGTPSRNASGDYIIYPCGKTNIEGDVYDGIVSDNLGFNWTHIIPNTGIPGSPTYRLEPTPNTSNDLYSLIPATLVASQDDLGRNDIDILGELEGVWWISAASGVGNEDYIDDGDIRYRIFQNGNRNEVFSFMAMEEN